MTPRPPRKAIPLSVKLEAALWALGLDPADVEWDHDPALGLRPLNEAGDDTVPAQLDPRHIVPRSRAAHALKTDGDHVPLSGDKSQIAKTKRLEQGPAVEEAFASGRASRKDNNLQVGECPYPVRTPERRAWISGWFAADHVMTREPLKRQWPKRPFPKTKPATGGQAAGVRKAMGKFYTALVARRKREKEVP